MHKRNFIVVEAASINREALAINVRHDPHGMAERIRQLSDREVQNLPAALVRGILALMAAADPNEMARHIRALSEKEVAHLPQSLWSEGTYGNERIVAAPGR